MAHDQRNAGAPFGLTRELTLGLEEQAPPGTVIASRPLHGPCPPLLPTEERTVAGAAPSRVQEFAIGRACAREALGQLGLDPCAIPAGVDRRPIFPPGVAGSITHSSGICMVAAARSATVGSLGIDLERTDSLDPSLIPRVCLPVERAAGPALGPTWPTLHFSGKESVYKARQAIAPGWLDFDDVRLSFSLPGRSFTAMVSGSAPPTRFEGRFVVLPGFVATLVWPLAEGPSGDDSEGSSSRSGSGPPGPAR